MATYFKQKSNGDVYVGSTRLSEGDYVPGQAWLSENQIRGLLKAYDADEMTVRAIAKEWEVTERTVARIAQRFGRSPKLNAPRATPQEIAEAAKMWFDESVSLQAIANKLHVSIQRARSLLRQKGYPTPHRGRLFAKPYQSDPNYNARRTAAAKEKFVAHHKLRMQGISWSKIVPDNPRRAVLHHSQMKKLHPDWVHDVNNA